MKLMRNDLRSIFPNINNAHAGLLIQRGLTDWEKNNDEKSVKSAKSELIDKISAVFPSKLYLLAFNRWLDATHEESDDSFATLAATVEGRLYTGLPLGGTLETGASIHHTYGMPMIPGSSVKGAVRSYTEHLFAKRNDDGALQFTKSDNENKLLIQDDKQAVLDVLFGADSDDVDESNAGYLIWHDAWWIPMVDDDGELSIGYQEKPFVDEIVTVHHQAYYNRNIDEALDMENPIPNQQLAIQGSFYFAIEGEQQWIALAKQLLQQTIDNVGLGSKTSSGYGYFTLNSEAYETHIALKKINKSRIEQEEVKDKKYKDMESLTDNEKIIYQFTDLLSALPKMQWSNKANNPPYFIIDNTNYSFTELFKIAIEWENQSEQKYTLEHLFLPYLPILLGDKISTNKKWHSRIKSLKEKAGFK